MAQTVCVILSLSDRQVLEAIVADRNRSQKHVERARVVLASADRDPVQVVAARLGVSRPMVWRWQQRFAEEGADGLLRPRAKPSGEKQKPMDATVKLASKVEKGYTPTLAEAQKMAGRILDDQRNDPKPHREPPKKA